MKKKKRKKKDVVCAYIILGVFNSMIYYIDNFKQWLKHSVNNYTNP